jgi:hypothetical protein
VGENAGSNGGRDELSPVPILVMIATDRTGRIDIAVRGPVKGKDGLLALLDGARKIVEQWRE